MIVKAPVGRSEHQPVAQGVELFLAVSLVRLRYARCTVTAASQVVVRHRKRHIRRVVRTRAKSRAPGISPVGLESPEVEGVGLGTQSDEVIASGGWRQVRSIQIGRQQSEVIGRELKALLFSRPSGQHTAAIINARASTEVLPNILAVRAGSDVIQDRKS